MSDYVTLNMGRKEPRILEALQLLLQADLKEMGDAPASAGTCRNQAYVILYNLVKTETWKPDKDEQELLDRAYGEMRLLGSLDRLTLPTGWVSMTTTDSTLTRE
jgi:hypothetical protein